MTANQASALAQQFGLGPVDQVAFIVRNMEQALPAYEAIFGKFHVMTIPNMKAQHRGKDITATLKLALTKSGSMEIEVIEAVGGFGPYGEHLERHGEGLHHIRFQVKSLQDTLQAMEPAGFVNVYGGKAGTVRWAYLESPTTLGHTLLELVEGLPA